MLESLLKVALQFGRETFSHFKMASAALPTLPAFTKLKVFYSITLIHYLTLQTLNAKGTPNNRHINKVLQKQVKKTGQGAEEKNDRSNDKDQQIRPIPQPNIKFWFCHKSHRLKNCFIFFKRSKFRRMKRIC